VDVWPLNRRRKVIDDSIDLTPDAQWHLACEFIFSFIFEKNLPPFPVFYFE
jgi:hypothetical protein